MLKLFENEEAAWILAKTVAYNFDELPEEVRNELLLKLAEKEGTAWIVAWTVVDNLDKIPKEVRKRLPEEVKIQIIFLLDNRIGGVM